MIDAKLPPLNALRAFEAAARHLSVKNAAEELCVTPGAVSQMLKVLEQHLGVRLFVRVNRGIFLTDAGRDYLPPVRNAFRQIVDASKRVAGSQDSGVLTVSATSFFASAWLVPRMASFRDAHPQIDLQVVTSNALVDFSRSGVDVAFRHGYGHYPGLRSDHVLAVAMAPVAAPSLVERLGLPASAAALVAWPKVQDADRKGWSLWLQANNLTEATLPTGPSFDDTALLQQAVLAGLGAGLLPAAMVAPEIEAGRLIQLAEETHIEAFAYYLVYPEATAEQPKISAFRQWVLEAIGSGVSRSHPR
ncbi:MAG TPA: transcriptional regulator GcvA [Ensifer sp.]|jgi:LysR family glycine cleavage system transcriptional activator|uniref:transcriptional regulator GcvA n=1 Tax=Ensifer sp. TaxID=1872086 RepID=UPI002E115985|nr:transcriptional regulator GcvA [Ensifer sp.]